MKITRIERRTEKGELEVSFALTEQQTQALLEFAINTLVAQGFVTYMTQVESNVEPDKDISLEEAMTEVMNQADPKDLPQA